MGGSTPASMQNLRSIFCPSAKHALAIRRVARSPILHFVSSAPHPEGSDISGARMFRLAAFRQFSLNALALDRQAPTHFCVSSQRPAMG